MHWNDETSNEFWHVCLDNIENYSYAFIWRRGDYRFYFLYRNGNWQLCIKCVEWLDEDEIRDKAEQDFDYYAKWVEAVQNWETEDSYRDWQGDTNIWDYENEWDYYGADTEVVKQLNELWLWNDEDDDYYDGNYLNEEYWGEFSKSNVERLSDILDNNCLNNNLLEDMENAFGVKEIQFLDCENIR